MLGKGCTNKLYSHDLLKLLTRGIDQQLFVPLKGGWGFQEERDYRQASPQSPEKWPKNYITASWVCLHPLSLTL